MNPLLVLGGLLLGGWALTRGRAGSLIPSVLTGRGTLTHERVAVDGVTRTFDLYVPRRQGPTAVVVLLHGSGGNSRTMQGHGWERVAEQYGLVLVFPAALMGQITRKTAWNHRLGLVPANQAQSPYSDIAFLDTLYQLVTQRFPTVRSNFLVGFSSGGMMTYRYASERARNLTGFCALNSTIGTAHVEQGYPLVVYAPKSGPTNAIFLHGGADNWQGGEATTKTAADGNWLPLADSVKYWRAADHANTPAPVGSIGVPVEWHERWTGMSGRAATHYSVEVLVDKGRGHWLPRNWPWADYVWRAFDAMR